MLGPGKLHFSPEILEKQVFFSENLKRHTVVIWSFDFSLDKLRYECPEYTLIKAVLLPHLGYGFLVCLSEIVE
jgi:hypothetical protein